MQFNSLVFLIFLPVVFLLYWQLMRWRRWQTALLVMASYVFYGWWDWRFLGLIFLTSLLSYGSGLLMERLADYRRRQRQVCAVNVTLNLLILGVFKYFNFFAENLLWLLGWMGLKTDWVTLNVVLPVGISFYTFQALSYTIDGYRGTIRATHDVVAFFAYISFFPQLVAGPIERASRLLPQFAQSRRFDYGQAVDGCRQMLWGFFKKMVIADNCAVVVDMAWAGYGAESAPVLLVGALLFTFQIYCDFSGYSDIAVGCARLFGISLMRNFDYPYFAQNIGDFWRRWHISLMTWLRDYVYIPLGGNRQGTARTLRNIFVVWAISGLWHGAAWNFVGWGLYHALLLCLWRLAMGSKRRRQGGGLAGTVLTFALVVVGWVIFRAPTLGDAMGYLHHLCDGSLLHPAQAMMALGMLPSAFATAVGGIVVMLVCEWRNRSKAHALEHIDCMVAGRIGALRYGFYVVMAMLTIALAGSQSAFIYFQF